ncbi:MAG: hypothetical protein P8I93_06150 [Crocinitomicaceae bacterium]|nr:hypothetical protein [Crocinitomicaceae bacterium]
MIDIIFAIPYFLLVFWMLGKIRFFKHSGFSIKSLQFAFLLKVFSGYILFYIYAYHYNNRIESDTFKYFDDSYHMYKAFFSNPIDYLKMLFGISCEGAHFDDLYYQDMYNWYRPYESSLYNDNRLIIRLNAFIRIFSFGNYHVHNLVFNLLSFIGLVGLARFFLYHLKNEWKIYMAVFLIPSVVFWGSGVLKESILMFAIGLFCYHLNKKIRLKVALILLLSLGIMLVLKFYVLMALLPVVIAWLLNKKQIKNIAFAYAVSILSISLVAFVIGYFIPEYNVISILVTKQNDFVNMANVMQVNSAFEMSPLTPDLWAIVKAIPEGLFNCFTKPWPTEIKNPLFVASFLENLLILVFIGGAIAWYKKPNKYSLKFILFCFAFTVFLFAIIGITTPITGALVRYKVPALPFLVIGILTFIDPKKINYPWKKKFVKKANKFLS